MSHEKHKENSPCGRGLRPRGRAGQGQGGGRASPGRGLDTPRWAFWYFPLSSALIKASGQKLRLLKPLMVEETDRERDFLSEGGGGLQGVRAGPCQASGKQATRAATQRGAQNTAVASTAASR